MRERAQQKAVSIVKCEKDLIIATIHPLLTRMLCILALMNLKKKLLTTTAWLLLAGTGGSIMVLSSFYLYLSPKLPSVESIRDYKLQTPLRVYTSDGKLIGEFGEKRRKPITFEEIPQTFLDALIATEDADFYTHNGVSFKGLLRAVSQLLLTGRKGSGGSTLTMQLTRHVFLSLKQTYSRKFNEILLALRIEDELTKEEILELYVNLMFLGKRAYGIEAAAEVYYGKSIDELSLAQHAMLVGVFKGPSTLNPIANPTRAQERRDYILGRMKKLEYIDQAQYSAAVKEPVVARYHGSKVEIHAPYVAEMARKKAIRSFGKKVYTDGYRVYTTVESSLQVKAQDAVVDGLITYDERHGYRGPEQTLSTEGLEIITAPAEPKAGESAQEESGTTGEQEPAGPSLHLSEDWDSQEWETALAAIPDYGGLLAASVIGTSDKTLDILFANGTRGKILWDDGLSSARSYLSEDSRGPKPKRASEVANIGDIIRVNEQDGRWHLKQVPSAQAALVAVAPRNGAILSLVGGFDFSHSAFNRAIQAQRQPGSNFKPFIYTAALENGLTPSTIINDAPIVLDDSQLENTWRPENAGGKFYGPTRLRKALYLSRNLVSIRVLRSIGINNAIKGLEKFGFDPKTLQKDLSLSLGTHAVTPLDIAAGYAIFANGGFRVDPYMVQRILDLEGRTLYEALPATVCRDCDKDQQHLVLNTQARQEIERQGVDQLGNQGAPTNSPYDFADDAFGLSFDLKSLLGILEPEDYPTAPKVIDDQVAYIIDSMLRDVIKRGTGTKAKRLGRRDLAGKTGTTNGPLDAWFSGYNGHIVTTTWVGFDQNSPLGRFEYGGTAALPIWIDFMSTALKGKPESRRARPPGIVEVRINPETGKRAKIGDPDAIFEIFRTANVPEIEEDSAENPYETEEVISEGLF